MCSLSDGFINNHQLQQTIFSLLFSLLHCCSSTFSFFGADTTYLCNCWKCANTFYCWHYGVKYVCHLQNQGRSIGFYTSPRSNDFFSPNLAAPPFLPFEFPQLKNNLFVHPLPNTLVYFRLLQTWIASEPCIGGRYWKEGKCGTRSHRYPNLIYLLFHRYVKTGEQIPLQLLFLSATHQCGHLAYSEPRWTAADVCYRIWQWDQKAVMWMSD